MPLMNEPGQPRRRALRKVTVGVATAVAVLALGACKLRKEEGYYDIAPGAAYARVLNADIKGFRDARQCGMLIYFSTDPTPGRAIAWTITSGDIRVAKFTARFTAHEKGTIISIDVPKGPNGAEIYDGKQTYTHPAIMQPLRPSVRELIDAAIEGRSYDWRRIPDPLNTDGLCSSTRSNFQASGKPYSINEPSGMTHEMAIEANRQGAPLLAEHDRYFEGQ